MYQLTAAETTTNFEQRAIDLFVQATEQGATEIRVRVNRAHMDIWFRIKGDMVEIHQDSPDYGLRLCTSIYSSLTDPESIAGNPFNTRDRQSASISTASHLGHDRLDAIRIETAPTKEGFVMNARLLRKAEEHTSLETLGWESYHLEQIEYLKLLPSSIMFMSGPTGSGKTTSLATICTSILQESNNEINLITIEDPAEIPMPDAVQTVIKKYADESVRLREYNQAIVGALRLDADVLMIGEVRDIRDSIQSIAVSGLSYNPAKNIKQGFALTNPKGDAYFKLLAGGGTIHFATMLEGSESRRVRSLVESGVDDSTILDNESKLNAFYKRNIEPAVNAYNELGNRGEAINRAALYDQLIKQGVGHAEASLQARDLLDFSMGGSWTSIRFLTQTVPFMNARIQGLYKLGKAAKNDPARFGAVLGATAMFSIALMLAYSDDDDWKKREDWDRDNYWWFKFGGTAFRIPKPFEIGAIASLAERGVELYSSDEMTGDRFRKRLYALLSDNLSMNPVPQLVKPILDVYANKDSFTGRPIETMGMERLLPDYRFNQHTSMAARGISTAGNMVTGEHFMSPVQVDHLIQGYFGWLGTFVVGAGDYLARPATSQPSNATPDYLKMATGGLARKLPETQSRYVSQMYDQAKEIEQAYGTYRSLIKQGNRDDAKEFRGDNVEMLRKYHQVENLKAMTSRNNEQIRSIERNASLSSDEKRDKINKVRERQETMAKRFSESRQ